ncbi:MAG TPA: hypothetical protein DHW02_09420 [Ktedonobacter sp.]|nr:hypothetical protein [Ktedonobacter sp.]
MDISQQHTFEDLLNATREGIFQLDTQGYFSYVNRAFSHIVGLPIHDIIGHSGEELFIPIPLQAMEHAASAHSMEVSINTPNGTHHFEYTLSPIYTNDGTVKAFVGVLHDIEKRKQSEQQLNSFFNLASHELRTPLAAIKGNVQLALRQVRRLRKLDAPESDVFANKIEGMLTHAERQIEVEARMVGDMLDVSRIQNNRLEIYPHPCNLVEVVNSTIENERQANATRNIHLMLPQQETLTVDADAERIEQVLGNYLSNALKYASPELPITLSVETIEQQVRVSVQDEGPGLTSEEQQHVWDRFYQTPDRTVLNGQSTGLGLGLYLSKILIERQHGSVGVASEKGNGSTFWFTLPLVHGNAI